MLLTLFYAEFDDERGPTLVEQVPDGASALLSASSFDCVSDYVVAPPEACGSLVTVSTARRQTVAAFPISLDDARYARHRLAFSVGAVVASVDDAQRYEPLLRKAAQLLERLEVESSFLSKRRAGVSAPEHEQLRSFLRSVWQSVRETGRCAVSVTPGRVDVAAVNTLRFETRRGGAELSPREVVEAARPFPHEWEVPILTRAIGPTASAGWDLALRRALPFIDGTSCVRRIAVAADMDVGLVRRVVQQLVYFGCAAVVDIFQHSNLYVCTADIARLVRSRTLRRACRAYVCTGDRDRAGSAASGDGGGSPPLPPSSSPPLPSTNGSSSSRQRESTLLPLLLRLFAAFDGTATVAQLRTAYGSAMDAARIDVRRLVIWGQVHSILKRVHSFPLPRSSSAAAELLSGAAAHYSHGSGTLAALMERGAHIEALCVRSLRSFQEVDMEVRASARLAVVQSVGQRCIAASS